MKVELRYPPTDQQWEMVKRAAWTTARKRGEPKELPSSALRRNLLRARHSPIRLLTFGFLIEDIPSNTATHLVRHIHALPFVSSLRNDRQNIMDGDSAPRNTPVDMMYVVNAEELMTIANKRLCSKAAQNTREAVQLMCAEAEKAVPELAGLLVPMCEYHGGICHEINGCGKCMEGRDD